jgi:hypothetical protein
MDRDEVERLADVLDAAAETEVRIPTTWYLPVRDRVLAAVGDGVDLSAILPLQQGDLGGPYIRGGRIVPRVAAVYLRGLLARDASTSARQVAATDVLGQAQALLEDDDVHPAAPIVLAGAALEEALRGQVELREADVDGRPSIFTYATALRRAGVLNEADRALTDVVGKVRNAAAHGRFGDLHRDQAQLVVSQVALLLSKLTVGDAPTED